MNTILHSFGTRIALTLCLVAVAGLHPYAEEIAAPPELRDVATGDAVPAAETARTKDFGAVVLAGGMANVRTPLRAGDLILAVDGWRTHDFREFEIARYKQPTEPKMVLLINRRGTLETLKLADLPPGRNLGIAFDEAVEQGSFADVVETTGVPMDDSTRHALRSVSRHAAAALDAWRREAGAKPDIAWLQDFLKLYLSVQQRRYAEAAAPTNEAPIPYFQRLNKFHFAIAEKNKARELLPANWTEYGESAEFFVLNRPLPNFVPPPLSDVKLSDARFQRLLEKRRADYFGDHAELATAARAYLLVGAEGVDRLLNETKASLLDPEGQGGWPFRSSVVSDTEGRNVMLIELRKRLANAADPDWPLIAYATVGPLSLDSLRQEAADLIQELGKRSPFFGWAGSELCFVASRESKFSRRAMPRVEQMVKTNDFFLPKDGPEIFRWALRRIPPLMTENKKGSNTVDPIPLLTGSPLLELQALQTPEPAK